MNSLPESQQLLGDRVCGIDEAGRGPLAGPVIASAVVLNSNHKITGINDSKRLSPTVRASLAVQIKNRALAWGIGRAEVDEIDTINILQATMLAMRRAFEQLKIPMDLALVDGNQAPRLECRAQTVINGDARVETIGAASILAKTERDRIMTEYAHQFPQYGFDTNFGYYSVRHIQALKKYGPCPIHRKSFRPVADAIELNRSPRDIFEHI